MQKQFRIVLCQIAQTRIIQRRVSRPGVFGDQTLYKRRFARLTRAPDDNDGKMFRKINQPTFNFSRNVHN